ncbi:BfmA/BtgA family mobilization protein [Gillisia sp. JM1]|jgi:hypothetical protein|uniref:BfmA/BtgA family mobilization protein n=1 Tax=Gillisia sp. JM1 TaxID=1283286 RepID=UPI00047C4925|nr:BfmA/BtgA family mobilization protein [Gillisia sp. JM1]
MDERFKKEKFKTLSIKISIDKKFRLYCKNISRSHSMTLLLMMEFFEKNGISPEESLGPHVQTLEALIKKRINALIAIIKDIEKNQTKPTLAILQSLIEAADPKNKNWQQKKRDYEEDDTHPDFYK